MLQLLVQVLEVLTCAKAPLDITSFLKARECVCLCMHVADRLMGLCFLPVISVPLKLSGDSQPGRHPCVGLVISVPGLVLRMVSA